MRCLFRLFRTPQDWLALEGQVLLSWGIFNPNGPTLYCIGARSTGARGELEVFYRWMHFLGGQYSCLGYIRDQPGWLEQFLQIVVDTTRDRDTWSQEFVLFGTMPSFLSTLLPKESVPVIQAALARSAAIRKANWGRERYLLNKYGSDLFGRAGEEIRETLEGMKAGGDTSDFIDVTFAMHQHIPTFRDWTKSDIESRELADGDIEAWWDTVQDTNFHGAAHGAFAAAWVGASDPKRTDLKVVTPFMEVLEFLRHFKHPSFGG